MQKTENRATSRITTNTSTAELLAIYLEKWQTKGELERDLDERLSRRVGDLVRSSVTLIDLFTDVRSTVQPLARPKESLIFADDGTALEPDAAKVAPDVDKALRNLSLGSIAKLLKYRPPWGKQADGLFLDHGIASGLILADLRDAIRGIVATGTREEWLHEAVQLSFGLDHVRRADKVSYHLNVLLREAVVACMCHNLYPRYLSSAGLEETYRTRLEASPFAFLAILADTLQPWDRHKLMNRGYQMPPYGTSGDRFDIRIDRNTFFVSESGDRLQADDRIAKLRKDLDDFLQNGGDLIRVAVTEWS